MAPCTIRLCDKNSTTASFQKDGITFHRYPQDPNVKEKWINATRRDNWMPTKYSVICSRHFTKDCFIYLKNRRRLLQSVTLFLPLLSAGETQDATTSTRPSPPLKKENSFGAPSHFSSVNEKRLWLRATELTNKVAFKNKQLKNLREKARYLQKRLASFKTVLKELQNKRLIDFTNADLLSKLGVTSREILKQQILKSKKVVKKKSSKLRALVLTLNFDSEIDNSEKFTIY